MSLTSSQMNPEGKQILQLAEQGRADELWEDLRYRADNSLYYFTKVVLNYRDLTDALHLDFCLRCEEDMNELISGYLMQRGGFKSTIRTKAYALWRYLKDHNEGFLIVGESDTVAKKALIDIKWNILNNQLLRWLYPELKAVDPQHTKWTDAEVLLPRDTSFDEPTFTCDGVGAKRTGFHYSEIIFDDIIGDKAAASEAVMNAAWDWIAYSRGLLRDASKSRRAFVGTRWKHGTGDVYGKLMHTIPSMKWYVRSAVEDGKPTFPQRLNLQVLEGIKEEQGVYRYNCQYMNRPTAPGGADFELEWIKSYDVDPDGITIIPCDGSPTVSVNALNRGSFYDVSSGGVQAEAENAISGAGIDWYTRIFVIDDWADNCTIGKAVERWHVMNDHWRYHWNWYEQVGAQKVVEDFCAERKNIPCPYCTAGHYNSEGKLVHRRHRTIMPVGIKPPGGQSNKDERIRLYLQKPLENGRVYLPRGRAVQLREQIEQFPHHPLKDRLDTLAYLVFLLKAPTAPEEQESEQAAEAARKAKAKPFTQTERDYGGYS